MVKSDKILLPILMLALCASCEREIVPSPAVASHPMLFSMESIAQSRVSYDDQSNGGLSAKFDDGDKVGLYAYYNNFFYRYTEYDCYAESVIFVNQCLSIGVNNSAYYKPLRSWTFSTLYGDAPDIIDCVAYYPFEAGDNPNYVNMAHTSTGGAILEYYYVGHKGAAGTDVANAHTDFMTAHWREDSYDGDAALFRTTMLALPAIELGFTRRTASLNLQVTKPDDHDATIVVQSIEVYFDAYTKFTQTFTTPTAAWDESSMTSGYALRATATCVAKQLAKTSWSSMPDDDTEYVTGKLLSDDQMLFFPPDTDIQKIVFTLTDGGVAKTYAWHPHIAPIEANRNYVISLELDPERDN